MSKWRQGSKTGTLAISGYGEWSFLGMHHIARPMYLEHPLPVMHRLDHPAM